MADETNKDFLEASDQDLQSLAEYVNADENAEVYAEIEKTHAAGAQQIVDSVMSAMGKEAADTPPSNQISMFDKDEFLKNAKENYVHGFEKTASYDGPVDSGALAGFSSSSNVIQRPYTSPMLTLSDFKMPKTTNEFFKWCKYYYTFDPLIAGAINACATFPVTEIYLEDMVANEGEGKISDEGVRGEKGESDTLKTYKRVLIDNMNLVNFCILIGIDYSLYGNCFVFGEMKQGADGKPEWSKLVRLDPNKIYIDYNPVDQSRRYRWVVPDKIARICREKAPKDEYNKIPEIIKQAVREKKSILLNSERIYHFYRPSDSAGDGGVWGIPVIAHVLKLITYRNILRQAQEAIAREHIVPMRIFYLQNQGHGSDYVQTTDWSNVAQNMAAHITRSVRDPNYKVVSPYPMGVLNVGGEGRQLLLTPEIEQVQNEILAGMNVPREFIFGGVSYSGTSISLRILENQFITYRLKLLDFINNFLIKGMAKARGEWASELDDDRLVTAKMVDMKMVDDVQQKQIIVDLNARNKVTDDYMWKALGLDPDKIRAGLKKEALEQIDNNVEIQKKTIDAEIEVQKYKEEMYRKAGLMQDQTQQVQEGQGQEMQGQGQAPDDAQMQQGQDGQGQPQGQAPDEAQMQQGQQQGEPQDAGQAPEGTQGQEGSQKEDQLYATARKIMELPQKQRSAFLQQFPEDVRRALEEIIQVLESEEQRNRDTKVNMTPMPQQKPPRRKGY